MNSIKIYREKSGMSQAGLADRVSVSQQAVSQWESNNKTPTAKKLVELANIFQCTVDDLLREQEGDSGRAASYGRDSSSLRSSE